MALTIHSYVLPSVKEDGNDLMIEYIHWGDMYMWNVFYFSLVEDDYFTVTNENGIVTVEKRV